MPLRKEVRFQYGRAHRELRAAMIAIYGLICQKCRREHKRVNLAHLNHDAGSAKAVTLLCPTCHAKHDTRQRVAMTRRTRSRRSGQGWLTPQLEYAPFASWEIPEPVRDVALQQPLFPLV